MADQQSLRRKTVLLAEDDQVARDIVSHILAELSTVDLVVACDGKQALEAALSRRFDLLIVDQNMPYIAGDRVVRQLKAGRTVNADSPVIRLTAHADASTAISGPFGNGTVTIPKPIRIQDFLSVVRSLLSI